MSTTKLLIIPILLVCLVGCVTNKGSVSLIDLDNRNAEERRADNTCVVTSQPAVTTQVLPTIWLKFLEILPGFRRVRILSVDWMVVPTPVTNVECKVKGK